MIIIFCAWAGCLSVLKIFNKQCRHGSDRRVQPRRPPQSRLLLKRSPLTTPAAKRKRVSNSAKGVGLFVGFIGSGNMARALAEGMIASGD